jgi:Tfp pilus assembly protein PilF
VAEAAALLEKEAYWDAIQKIEPVLETLTGPPRLKAQLVLARCYLQNPHWVKEAKETLETAARENPESVEVYSLLGSFYRKAGLRARAASMYRRVLELRPDDEDAAAALAELAPPAEEPPPEEEGGGGFLKKMFKR